MYLLDTHVLLWYTLDPEKLTEPALKALNEIEKEGLGYYSSISLWELGVKIKNNKLDIGMTIDQFTRGLKTMGTLVDLPVTTEVWLESLRLDCAHKYPADRTIVATARLRALPVISKDLLIIDSGQVDTIW